MQCNNSLNNYVKNITGQSQRNLSNRGNQNATSNQSIETQQQSDNLSCTKKILAQITNKIAPNFNQFKCATSKHQKQPQTQQTQQQQQFQLQYQQQGSFRDTSDNLNVFKLTSQNPCLYTDHSLNQKSPHYNNGETNSSSSFITNPINFADYKIKCAQNKSVTQRLKTTSSHLNLQKAKSPTNQSNKSMKTIFSNQTNKITNTETNESISTNQQKSILSNQAFDYKLNLASHVQNSQNQTSQLITNKENRIATQYEQSNLQFYQNFINNHNNNHNNLQFTQSKEKEGLSKDNSSLKLHQLKV
eukprot:TRINITY_DN11304_c0_g3_i2.p1 TRINITY_DN11304_c0_g3~~TRINITY_DN11304_c0_g3_i2.p1  ORF type:complete len:302 (+),score=46.95 TRINITY_DN11304_c0_g3_i2:385-1290(+)